MDLQLEDCLEITTDLPDPLGALGSESMFPATLLPHHSVLSLCFSKGHALVLVHCVCLGKYLIAKLNFNYDNLHHPLDTTRTV